MAFAGYLKQSTAVDILLGPCIDDTDGKTAETGLTLDVELSKNGQALADSESGAPTHDAAGTVDGYYNCVLGTTDTNTLGILTVVVHAAGFLPVRHDYQVVTANWFDTMCSTDQLDVNVTNVAGTAQTGNDNGADINAILVDTADMQPRVAAIEVDTGTTLENRLIAIEADTDVIDDGTSGLVKIASDVAAVLVDTADMQPRVAAIEVDTGTTLQAELDGIQADTEDLQTQIGAAGAGLSNVPWNAAWDAQVESECTDALNAYDPPTKAELDTVQGAVTLANGAHGGGAAAITLADYSDFTGAGATNPNVLLTAEIATVTNQTTFTLATGSDIDGAYDDQAIVLYDETNSDYPSVRVVSSYTGATKTIVIDSAPDFTLGADDSIRIFVTAPGTAAPTAATVADAVWDEAQADHVGAGTFGVVAGEVADILTDTGTTIPGTITTMQGNVTDILADTNELQGDWANGGRLDLIQDAILDDTDLIDDGASGLAKIATDVAAVLVDTETTIPGTITTMQGDVTDILTDTNELQVDDTPGALSAIDTKIDTIDNFLDTEVAAILEDTGTTLPATLATIAGYLDTEIAAILADTGELQTDWANGGRLDLILDAILAMLDDARTEPGDTAPPVNPDAMTKLDYLYKFMRNKIETTSTRIHIYDDAGTNKDHSSVISDDATTFTRGEFGVGDA